MLVSPISTAIKDISNHSLSANSHSSVTNGASFNDVFQQISSDIERIDDELLASQFDLVNGNARDMHTAILAAEKASLTLDLIVSVRNKAIEAYQEIMRMPL